MGLSTHVGHALGSPRKTIKSRELPRSPVTHCQSTVPAIADSRGLMQESYQTNRRSNTWMPKNSARLEDRPSELHWKPLLISSPNHPPPKTLPELRHEMSKNLLLSLFERCLEMMSSDLQDALLSMIGEGHLCMDCTIFINTTASWDLMTRVS